MTGKAWTPEKETQLAELWGAGLTASEIAKKMGVSSRCAVIGKAHRLKLPSRAVPPALAQYAKKLKANKHKIDLAPPPDPTDQGLSIMDLTEDTCRWMVGKHRYCGCQIMPGSPYCEAHDADAYVPTKKKISVHPYHLG